MDSTQTLTRRGRLVRLVATALGAALLLAGSIWGDDDHFPFGPFRMYASAVDPDAPTIDTRLEGTTADGETLLLDEYNTGLRRAEIEGQLERFRADPGLLGAVAEAYARRNPDAPPLREVRIVIRWHEVRDFQPTGRSREELVASWRP